MQLKRTRLIAVSAMLIASAANAQEVETPQQQIGYFLGLSVGQQMGQSGFEQADFSIDSLVAGFKDGLGGKESVLSDDQLRATQAEIQKLLKARLAKRLEEQKAKGEKYLAANAKKEGVKLLEGGLQYKVLKSGQGASPIETDTVVVHYTGKLIDGTMFDSSVQKGKPATFRVNRVIQGWQMALQKMKVGDKWMLYIPSELAYKENGSPPVIGPNQVLVFEVELLEIQ